VRRQEGLASGCQRPCIEQRLCGDVQGRQQALEIGGQAGRQGPHPTPPRSARPPLSQIWKRGGGEGHPGQQRHLGDAIGRPGQEAQGEGALSPFPEVGQGLGPAAQDLGQAGRFRLAGGDGGQEVRQAGDAQAEEG